MKTLNKIGIASALTFMVMELTYINAKSLLYIVDSFGTIDKAFAIIGSLAFSMVTVLVMRSGQSQWMKVVFPLFDALMVFCGFNLKFADKLTANPIALYLTVFMALFTGLIMFSLGKIDFKLTSNLENKESNLLLSDLNLLQGKYKQLESDFYENETELNSLKSKLSDKQTELNSLNKHYDSLKTDLEKYKTVFIQAELSRIKKKKRENCTPEELDLLEKN